MSIATFDKLAYLDSLKSAGIPEDQARAHTKALDDALKDSVVTTQVLKDELSPIKAEMLVIKWMLGVLIAGVVSLVIKAFV
jgi:hypothetical protein